MDAANTIAALAREIVCRHENEAERFRNHQLAGRGVEDYEHKTLIEIVGEVLNDRINRDRAVLQQVAQKLVHGYNEALSGDSEELVMDATTALELIGPLPEDESPLDFQTFWQSALERLDSKDTEDHNDRSRRTG